MRRLKTISGSNDIRKYGHEIASRPALLMAIVMMTSIVLIRMLIIGVNGSIDGYDRDCLDNKFVANGIDEGDWITIYGRVDVIQAKEYEYTGAIYNLYLADVKFSDGVRLTRPWEKIIIIVDSADYIHIGQWLELRGKLKYHNKATNWGEFDAYSYYSNKGIICRLDDAQILLYSAEYSEVRNRLWRFRQKVDRKISEIYGEEDGAILKAMLLGNKDEIPERIKEAFQKCGIAHILAISGLHISFLCMAIYKLLDALRFRRWINILISEVIMVLYILMVGLTASSVRAAVMFSLFIISVILKRSYDMISAACASAIIILGFNPWNLWDFSFQLSFLAIAGIGVFYKLFLNNSIYLKTVLKKRDSSGLSGKLYNLVVASGLNNLCVSIWVFLVTLPVLLWGYYEIAMYSVLLNLLILPLMPALLVCAILGTLLTTLVGGLGAVFVFFARLILVFYKYGCIYMEDSGIGRHNFGKPTLGMVVIYYLLLISICMIKGNRALLVRGICFLLCLISLRINSDGIYMLDVGQGDCFVAIQNHKAYVMDGGSTSRKNVGENVIIPFLKSKGINEIGAIFVSHPDEDHIGGIYELIEKGKNECIEIKRIYVYDESLKYGQYEELICLANENHVGIEGISAGYELQERDLYITCLFPDGRLADNSNDNSLVLRIDLDGICMIEAADMEKASEEKLDGLDIRADILKVAHHGSSSSTGEGFLNEVDPAIALISAGRNNRYGHPHAEVIDLLNKKNIEIIKTMDSGAVWIKSFKNGIKIKSFL